MACFHINPKTGTPGPCKAKSTCPFGGADEHFATEAEARHCFELVMRAVNPDPTASEHGVPMPSLAAAELVARMATREGQPAFVEEMVVVTYDNGEDPAPEDFDDNDDYEDAKDLFEADFANGYLEERAAATTYKVHSFPDQEAVMAFEHRGLWGKGSHSMDLPRLLTHGSTYSTDTPDSDSIALTKTYSKVKYFEAR